MRMTVYVVEDTYSFDAVSYADAITLEVPDGTEIKGTRLFGALAFLPPWNGVSLGLTAAGTGQAEGGAGGFAGRERAEKEGGVMARRKATPILDTPCEIRNGYPVCPKCNTEVAVLFDGWCSPCGGLRRCRKCRNGRYKSNPSPNWMNRFTCDKCKHSISK